MKFSNRQISYPGKIIIADDDAEELFITSRILKKSGYIVEPADSGKEAISKAKKFKPDLIVLDVVMPGMDGFETCRVIKSDPFLKAVFVILLSSIKKTPDYQALGLDAGADGFIARPFHIEEFLSRIRSIMRIKAVEDELRIQQQWLRITLSSIGDGLITTDRQGSILFLNPVAERITGWSQEQAKSKDIETVFPVFDGTTDAPIESPVRKVLQSGRIIQLDDEVVLINKQKERVPVTDSASPIRSDSGEIVGGVLVFRDVSEKKIYEQKINRMLKEWGAMFRAIGQMTLIIDPRHGILDANDIALKKTGLTRKEIIGMKCFEVIHGNTKPPPNCPMVKAMASGIQESSTMPMERIQGDYLISCTPVVNTQGTIEKIIHIATDISALKKAEEELRKSESRYRSILDAMNDATYICSSDFQIEYMNPAMTNLIGSDVTGQYCYKAIYDLDERCSRCDLPEVLRGERIKGEHVRELNGRTYHVSFSPMTNPDGSVSQLTVFRDVTEAKQMEVRLQQAHKMEAIGSLAGGVAHDFNNILFPIIGMAELLLEDLPPGSPEYENVREILNAGKRGSELVKQILSFSRRSEHKLVPVGIQFILEEVLKLARSTIPSYIELNENIKKNCGLLMANPTQIHQVVMNVITNAFHAVETTGGKISVSLKDIVLVKDDLDSLLLEPGRYAVLTISDNGHGIAPHHLNKIFEPYFTTKEKGKGTGIGLAVAYGIVKEHKGEIKVYSEVGKGTAFHIYLPVIDDSAAEKFTPETDTIPGGTEHILLVDDEDTIAGLEKKMLERLGYRTTVFTNSEKALNAFKTSPDSFDLIISDMAMPKLTGDQLAAKVLKMRPDIPFLICTGFSNRISPERAGEIGIKGFLMKPLIRNELAHMVRKLLDETKPGS